MLGVLYVCHIPVDDLTKKLWLLAITVLHSPLGQAGYPHARSPICFSHSHQCTNEKAKASCHYRPTPPLGQADYHLARIPICLSHSHRWPNEKAKASCYYPSTFPPKEGGLSPCLNSCMVLKFLSVNCRNCKVSYHHRPTHTSRAGELSSC